MILHERDVNNNFEQGLNKMFKPLWLFIAVIVVLILNFIFYLVAFKYFKDDLRYEVSGPRYDREFLPPDRELGRGSFGVVFQAKNKIDHCPYAIKMTMLPHRKEEQQRVLREARVLAKLDHENIVRYYSSWVEEGDACSNKQSPARPSKLFIQMQLCEGSLHDWLTNCKHGSGAQGEAKTIFSQIVSAVEYIHLMGLIHRDLKPGNIMFSGQRVKVGDFGLATALGDLSSDGKRPMADTSQQHTIGIGTPIFMSPEQRQGLRYSNKVDIYSLGLILFLLLHPFALKNGYDCLWKIRDQQFPSNLNQTECNVLSLMLSKDPSKRPTASEVKNLIE